MALTDYTYSIPGDFPGGAANPTKLVAEIQASPIGVALDRINTSGNTLVVWFKGTLSAGDKTLLDGDLSAPSGGLIAAHDNTPSEDDVQLVSLDPSKVHTVEIQEVSPGPLSYRNTAFPKLEIPASSDTGSTSISWPYDFYLLSIEYLAVEGSGASLGDTITAEIDPDRVLSSLLGPYGYLQDPVSIGDTSFRASLLALAPGLLQPGYYIRFGVPTNPEYLVIGVDSETGIVTLDTSISGDFSVGSEVIRTIPMGRDIWVAPIPVPITYGDTKIGASKIPKGWDLRISYRACNTSGRNIHVNAEGGIHEE